MRICNLNRRQAIGNRVRRVDLHFACCSHLPFACTDTIRGLQANPEELRLVFGKKISIQNKLLLDSLYGVFTRSFETLKILKRSVLPNAIQIEPVHSPI